MTSEGKCSNGNSCIQVDIYMGEHLMEPVVRLLSARTDTRMQVRISEWCKFVTEVKNGDWDHIDTDFEIVAGTDPKPRLLSDVVGPEVAAQIEESLTHPETFVRRGRPQRH